MQPLSRGAALLGGMSLLCGSFWGGGGGRRFSTAVFAVTVRERRKETRRYDDRRAALTPQLTVHLKPGRQCWIFLHLAKSGGMTVKTITRTRWKTAESIYDTAQWLKGDNSTANYAKRLMSGQEWHVSGGGYTEALRPHVEDACRWFTVFRNPIPRLVSAYFYCQQVPQDQACASNALNASEVDLMGFAKHWGNYAVRQFAVRFVNIDDVVEYAVASGACKTAGGCYYPGWYLLKMYLEREGDKLDDDDDGETSPDRAMNDMLIPIQDLLRDNFTAVGILEEFNSTLELYDRALGMPGLEWHARFQRLRIRNADHAYREQEQQALAAAWTNAELKQYIRLDLLLYEQAVAVFREQKEHYDIQ